jgi:outer membrane protein assembly factor BamA
VRNDLGARAAYTYRLGIYNTFVADLRYNQVHIADTVRKLSDVYLSRGFATMNYLSVNLGFIRDLRDSKPFPLKGSYLNVALNKTGLGLLNNEQPDFWQLAFTLRKYWKLNERLYAGTAFKTRWTGNGNVPFYLQTPVGYRDYVRGYEYYVVEGQSYGILKNELRYQIVKPHVKKIPFLPLEKFNTFHYALYAGIFADLAYVQSKDIQSMTKNTLNNTLMYGYGLGIDFVTYYDIVLRVEYAFNRMGENGLFLHLNTPL